MPTPSPCRRLLQTAFIVDDLESACLRWVETTGIGPFLIVPHVILEEFSYRGTPGKALDFSVAIAQGGGVQVELIQQHCDNPSAYRDLIAKGDRGFHHIGLYPDDYDATYAFYAEQGHVPAIEGVFGDKRFVYFDTSAAIGCMVELIEQNPIQSDLFARVEAAARDWDGITAPIRPGFA